MGAILRKPTNKAILATATALTASYAKIGSAINIEGWHNLTLHCKQTTGTVNALVRAYLSLTGAAPIISTSMYQLVTTAGAEVEFTTLDSEYASFNLQGLSAKYALFYAKNSGGTAGTLIANITGNVPTVNGRVAKQLNATVLTTTELAGTSYADVGNVINIEGYENLTLHVYESVGTEGASITPFVTISGSAPTATTTMQQFCAAAGTELVYTILKGEYASFPLEGLTGKYLMLKAKDTAVGAGHATLAITITGSIASL